ncbi:MAG: amino acid permease, partial [Planctomycetota bacterium]
RHTPAAAVLLVGAAIAGLCCLGSVKTTWSFSAMTVLVYYALTNAAALRLPRDQRIFPRVFAWIGLAACLGLIVFIQPAIWLAGAALLLIGLLWHLLMRRRARRANAA